MTSDRMESDPGRERRVTARLLRTWMHTSKMSSESKKLFWRWFYSVLSIRRRNLITALLNYGYAPVDEQPSGAEQDVAGARPADNSDHAVAGQAWIDEQQGVDRYGLALYGVVAGAVDLSGKDVLEVGCGRGGGAAFVFDRFKPRTMTGVDLAKTAIQRCRELHARPGLHFAVADAEDLPFPDGSFDAVISVESSHCYPNFNTFLSEVRRVLRPGGFLLIADFRRTTAGTDDEPGTDVAGLREQLAARGFNALDFEDITPNVLRARQLATPRTRARTEGRVPRPLQKYLLEFSSVEGSAIYRAFDEGHMSYVRLALQKTDGDGAVGREAAEQTAGA